MHDAEGILDNDLHGLPSTSGRKRKAQASTGEETARRPTRLAKPQKDPAKTFEANHLAPGDMAGDRRLMSEAVDSELV